MANEKAENDINVKKSFAVVICLVIAMFVIGAILAFLDQPESSASTDPDPKTESIGSCASEWINAIATELKKTIREQNSGGRVHIF